MAELLSELLDPERTTLAEAKAWLRERLAEGAACPCCTQLAKIYRRKVNSSMARGLIVAYRAHGLEFGYLQDLRHRRGLDNREESKLRYWLLMEEEPTLRPDGGRAGWWRVTELGERWVREQVRIPKYARIYDGRCLGLVGDPITIRDALGSRFDYRELMEGL